MRAFSQIMGIRDGLKILDLGGQPGIWKDVQERLNITILNLPGAAKFNEQSHHIFTYIEGDACSIGEVADQSFDIVFSNSVIEHVGANQKQKDFSDQVRRFGSAYWIQTPAIWFPIEAHTGMPFWWFYPDPMREYFFRGWMKKLPAWTESMRETTVLSKERIQELFPEAEIVVEKYLLIPKSYVAWYRKS